MSVSVRSTGKTGTVILDRPERRNAFDGPMISDLMNAFSGLAGDPAVRAIVLRGEGGVFSAGADLQWMRKMAAASPDENLADARHLAELMRLVDTCPKPCIARVEGAALGGAIGLIACCDIAVASEDASFGLSEVRLGLIPAVIGPYVVRAMGPGAARRLFLTGERISAHEAQTCGLVHHVATPSKLDECVDGQLAAILRGGPAAQAAAKALVAGLSPISDEIIAMTATRIAEIRATGEAREGLAAFLEKRKPRWLAE